MKISLVFWKVLASPVAKNLLAYHSMTKEGVGRAECRDAVCEDAKQFPDLSPLAPGSRKRITPMKSTSLKDTYLAERQELFSVEEQLDEFLLEVGEVASNMQSSTVGRRRCSNKAGLSRFRKDTAPAPGRTRTKPCKL
jgi:hypothetical protein